MKSFFAFIFLAFIAILFWMQSRFWEFKREDYLSKKVLELSAPFDVKIDTVFLKSLEPANESSRTSPEGI